LPRVRGGGGGAQLLGAPALGHHGAIGLTGQFAGREGQGFPTYLTGYGDFGHSCAPLLLWERPVGSCQPSIEDSQLTTGRLLLTELAFFVTFYYPHPR